MPAGAPLLEGQEVGAPDQAWAKLAPSTRPSAAATLCRSSGIHEAALAEVQRTRSRFTIEISQPQAWN